MLRLITFCLALAASTSHGAPLIELTTSGSPVQGRQLAFNKTDCWLVDIDGRLIHVPLNTVTEFRQVEPEFTARPVADVKKALQKELGPQFEVAVRGIHVVAAPRGRADHFASLFDTTSREFLQYLRVRKFKVDDPDLPLVAVVYPTRNEFLAQCARDGVSAGSALRGYYDQHSNRVALYEDPLEGAVAVSTPKPAEPAGGKRPGSARDAASARKSLDANSGPSASATMARETAVHEAIHQLAFNSGLHSRIGNNPLWVVEGIAMQFERGEKGYLKTRTSQRVNVPRLANFETYREERRKSGSLAQTIASDDAFRKQPLDAYGEAWLFTNYLIETRPQKFGQYLQTLACRNPIEPYRPEDRLRDFQANFGEDLAWLEIEYIRYAEKVAAEANTAAEPKKR